MCLSDRRSEDILLIKTTQKLCIFSLFPGCKESRVAHRHLVSVPANSGERCGRRTQCWGWAFPFLVLFQHFCPAPISTCLLYLQLKHPTDPARQELRSWASSWQRDIEGLLQFLCTTSADGTWKRRWACHRCLLQCLVCKQDRRLSEVWELSISHRRGKNHKLLLKSYLRIELEMKEFLEFLRAAEMLFRLHLKGHVFWLFFFKQVCNNCSFKKKRNIGTMELQ